MPLGYFILFAITRTKSQECLKINSKLIRCKHVCDMRVYSWKGPPILGLYTPVRKILDIFSGRRCTLNSI